jgi:hypothetical protein
MTNDFICCPPKGVLVPTPPPDPGRRERYGITYRAMKLAEETPAIQMGIIGSSAFPLLVQGVFFWNARTFFVHSLEFLFHFCRTGVKVSISV